MGLFSKKLTESDVRAIVREELAPIKLKLEKIIMNQAELKNALDAATAKVTKIEAEQTQRFDKQSALIVTQSAEIQRLTDLLNAGGEVSPDVMASLNALQANLNAFDDTIPDPAEPPAAK